MVVDFDFEHCPVCNSIISLESSVEFFCDACKSAFWMDDNGEWILDDINDDDYNEFDETMEIPEGCAACGGDYPNCIDSCNLMSD